MLKRVVVQLVACTSQRLANMEYCHGCWGQLGLLTLVGAINGSRWGAFHASPRPFPFPSSACTPNTRKRGREGWKRGSNIGTMHVLLTLAMIPFHVEFSCTESHTRRAYEDEEVVHVISPLWCLFARGRCS